MLIALLPLQGIAASFMVTCEGMAAAPAKLAKPAEAGAMPCHEMATLSIEQPCHEHSAHSGFDDNSGTLAGNLLDQGCCHHFAVAIPQLFALPGVALARGQIYPAIAASFSDHLPDRLQRPPLSLVI